MDHDGLSESDVAYLFSNLETLNQLAEQCIRSTATDATSINRHQTVTDETFHACVRTTAPEIDVVTDAITSVIVRSSGDGFSIQSSSSVTNASSDARIQSNAHVASSLNSRCHMETHSRDNHSQLITSNTRRQTTCER